MNIFDLMIDFKGLLKEPSNENRCVNDSLGNFCWVNGVCRKCYELTSSLRKRVRLELDAARNSLRCHDTFHYPNFDFDLVKIGKVRV